MGLQGLHIGWLGLGYTKVVTRTNFTNLSQHEVFTVCMCHPVERNSLLQMLGRLVEQLVALALVLALLVGEYGDHRIHLD